MCTFAALYETIINVLITYIKTIYNNITDTQNLV